MNRQQQICSLPEDAIIGVCRKRPPFGLVVVRRRRKVRVRITSMRRTGITCHTPNPSVPAPRGDTANALVYTSAVFGTARMAWMPLPKRNRARTTTGRHRALQIVGLACFEPSQPARNFVSVSKPPPPIFPSRR